MGVMETFVSPLLQPAVLLIPQASAAEALAPRRPREFG